MATSNTANHLKTNLILSTNPVPATEFSQSTQVFTNSNDLYGYVCANVKDTDYFEIHVADEHLDDLLKIGIQDLEQIRCIYVYYDNQQTRQAVVSRFPSGSKVGGLFKFCRGGILEGQLENAETAEVVNPSGPINRSVRDNVVASKKKRLQEKSSNSNSPPPKRFARSTEHEFSAPNLNRRFFCPICQILFLEPYQLECGHRLCSSCVVRQNSCALCPQSISKDTAWFDQGLYNEQQQLITTCSECSWSGPYKHYQEHENQHTSSHASELEINRNLLHQEHLGSIERLPNAQAASFGGTFTWKIPNFQKKKMTSPLRWPNSNYSPPFYSSPLGYKMCLRLSNLNENNSSRSTYISLFLVIMRGDYDDTLQWPCNFEVTFTLLNQLEPNDSQSRSFWSDTNSISFQRPCADKNIPYGIPKCFPRDTLQQNENPFVRDDALLIKLQIDSSTKKEGTSTIISETASHNADAYELLDDAILFSSQLQ